MIKPQRKYFIGLDLGGTKILCGLVNDLGQVIKSKKILTKKTPDPNAIVRQMIDLIKEMAVGVIIERVGIGVPGLVDSITGFVHVAPNLGWHQFPLKQKLLTHLPFNIQILNDVRAATFGEWLFGAGRECRDFICLVMGTGIGGGIISNGTLLHGASNTAAELGHMVIDINGPPCTCGNNGCLEALAGGWAIAKEAKKHKQFATLTDVDAKMVLDLAKSYDKTSIEIIEHVIKAMVVASITLVNLFNPKKLIISGPIAENIPHLLPSIRLGIGKLAIGSQVAHVDVTPALLKSYSAVIGAAMFEVDIN